jgi:hypothetical protein
MQLTGCCGFGFPASGLAIGVRDREAGNGCGMAPQGVSDLLDMEDPGEASPGGRRILYVFLVLAHNRRRILHFAVTAHPTAEWTPQQMREAFPWESAPHYLLRDRYRILRPRLR